MRRSIVVMVVAGALVVGAIAGWAANGFTDVPEDSPHAPSIAWAVRNNIVSGKTPDTFDPHGPLTRAQMVTILYRYNQKFGPKTVELVTSDFVAPGSEYWRVGIEIQPGEYWVEFDDEAHWASCKVLIWKDFDATITRYWRTFSNSPFPLTITEDDAIVEFRLCG